MNGETFSLQCFCAREDKPYIMHFVRQPNGKYRCIESVKLGRRVNGPAAYVTSASTVRMDQIEGRLPCAWCGTGGINHCASHCGAFVCSGRKQGQLFICRDSCGARWVGTPLEVVEGETMQECLIAPIENAVSPKLHPASTALVRTQPQRAVSKSWWR